MRYTEYHVGVAVIKDKTLLKEAIQKLAKIEDDENSDIGNMSRDNMIKRLYGYCDHQTCAECVLRNEICAFGTMDEIQLKKAYKRLSESLVEVKLN